MSVKNKDQAKSKLLVWRQKGLTGYWFKYIDRPFCLQTNEIIVLKLCVRKM